MKSSEFISESIVDEAGSQEYGLRYKVFAGREGRITTKEKWFSSAEKLENFANKVQELGNFYEIDGYSYPQSGADALQADPLEEGPSEYMLHGLGGEMGRDRFQKPFKLKRDGRIIADFNSETEALNAWKEMPNNMGVKIVRESINEGRVYHMVLNNLMEAAGTTYGVKDKKGYNVYNGTEEGAKNYVKKNPGKGLTVTKTKSAADKKPVSEDASCGATGSASIAAAPAQNLLKKPVKRTKTNEDPNDSLSTFPKVEVEYADWIKMPPSKQREIKNKHQTGLKIVNKPAKKVTTESQLNEFGNGPGKITAPKVAYGQTRSGAGSYEKRPEELAKIKGQVSAEKEQQRQAKKARDARYAEPKRAAAPKVSLDRIWMKVEDVIGRTVPDGDPIDYIGPWCERNGIPYEMVNKAARKNGYKDMYAYYDEMVQHYNELTSDYGRNQ